VAALGVLTLTLGWLLGVAAAQGQVPRAATAEATLEEGYVVRVTLTDPGAGYGVPPAVTLSGGGGSGATAVAKAGNGAVEKIVLMSTGSGYSSKPAVVVAPPEMPMFESVGWVIELTIGGQVGTTHQILATDVLMPPLWRVLTNVVVTGSPYEWVDEEATSAQRYYRVAAASEAPVIESARLTSRLTVRGTVGTTNWILGGEGATPAVWRVLTNVVVGSDRYEWVDRGATLQRQYRVTARSEVPV
jgi:hypothetical protein